MNRSQLQVKPNYKSQIILDRDGVELISQLIIEKEVFLRIELNASYNSE